MMNFALITLNIKVNYDFNSFALAYRLWSMVFPIARHSPPDSV